LPCPAGGSSPGLWWKVKLVDVAGELLVLTILDGVWEVKHEAAYKRRFKTCFQRELLHALATYP